MKRAKKALFVLAIAGMLGVQMAGPQDASAVGFNIDGFVDPFNATIVADDGTNTTFNNLMYTFDVVSADGTAPLGFIQTTFESDVFVDMSSSILVSTDPSDWGLTNSTTVTGPPSLVNLEFDRGTPLTTGQRFSFVLDGVIVSNMALVDASLWDEGQIWSQSWSASDNLMGPLDVNGVTFRLTSAQDGGSTAPVPEPSTVVLLGSGLLGLALWGRKRVAQEIA